MQDIVDRVDRAKALIAEGSARGTGEARATEIGGELMDIGLDAIGELIANSRRIANAMEAIADRMPHGSQ
jgi:hypothetical protein